MMNLQGHKRVLERTCERFLPKFLQKTGFRRTPALRKKRSKPLNESDLNRLVL